MNINTNNITWKWLVGVLTTVVILAGSAWMASMSTELDKIRTEQAVDRKEAADVREKIGRIDERSRRTELDILEIKESQKELSRKLDELLRKVR
jgi:septal ring factor EnvC (AmiA/AmiB activator)